ncbi:MAG: IS66 family transposase [Paenibacillaceae bacterium]|nr:IS66 family transposase [Paenibacillaceae bacterium]
MKLSQEQILQISKGDKEIAAFITLLTDRIEQLENRVKDLERQLGKDSNNSSKPPSSDGLRKPTNLRQPGGKKGAPKGHPGNTLNFSSTPDEVVVHSLATCHHCAHSLGQVSVQRYIKRQVFELPLPRLVITEHRIEEKCCPACNTVQQARFPSGVKAPVQYGESFAAWTAYLSAYQLLPLERIAQLFTDLTGYRPSEATLLNQIQTMADVAAAQEQVVKDQLCNEPLLHCDETPMRVNTKPYYLHTHSTSEWTLLMAHENRCGKALIEMDVLPSYQGIVVHDFLSAYFKPEFGYKHALCNAHLLRECQGIAEHDHHQWASDMKELLQKCWEEVKAARAAQVPLSDQQIAEIEQRYDDILAKGKAEWAKDPVPAKTGPRGRKCKSPAANLGQRFELHKESILRFLCDPRVPFDNNQAERDIRMSKVKQKVSGCFRTPSGVKQFASIRGFISNLLKQRLPLHTSLVSALRGQFQFRLT